MERDRRTLNWLIALNVLTFILCLAIGVYIVYMSIAAPVLTPKEQELYNDSVELLDNYVDLFNGIFK